MNIEPLSDGKIIDSWKHNALPWMNAVRSGDIESRRLVTDRAVLDAVQACEPATVLDLGCGEGWLALALQHNGIGVTAVDVVPALVLAATQAGVVDGRVLSYEAIAAGQLKLSADVVVCNFSLLGNESVEQVLAAAPSLLNPGGALVVQTLHPVSACGERPYEDGWRDGSWAGFDPAFTDPAPWYFRTLQSWAALFPKHGLRLMEQREPMHPVSGIPASVVFIACAAREPG